MKKNGVLTGKAVLYVARTFPPRIGGMERFNFELLENLKARRPVIEAVNRWPRPLFLVFLLITCLKALIHAGRFKSIFLSDATLSLVGFFGKKFLGKRIVVYAHGLDVVYPGWFYRRYFQLFFNPDRIICNSRFTESLLKARGFKNTIVIPPGIERQSFSEIPFADRAFLEKKYNFISSKNSIIITVGRLVRRKGVAWLVENVMPILPPEVIFLIGGSGNQESVIKEKISKKHLTGRVYLLGFVDQKDLSSLYQLARVFVMPNLRVENDPEGFGIAALEAAAWGLPVVAALVDGIPDAITHKVNGILAQSGQALEFSNAIVQLLSDERNRRQFGQEARQRTLENFSWDNKIPEYIKAIYG